MKQISLYVYSAVVFLLMAAAVYTFYAPQAQTLASTSVELGFTELSPLGEVGGYAVPASGSSAPPPPPPPPVSTGTCVGSFTPNNVYVGATVLYQGNFTSFTPAPADSTWYVQHYPPGGPWAIRDSYANFGTMVPWFEPDGTFGTDGRDYVIDTTGLAPGIHAYRLHDTASPSSWCQATFRVQPIPTPIEVAITASSTTVPVGGNTTITWTIVAGNPTSCIARGDWAGSKNTSGGSEIQSGLVAPQNYTIECSDAVTTFTDSVGVDVGGSAPLTVDISASPTSVSYGGSTDVTWNIVSGNPTSCVASGDWSGSKSVTGGTETRSGLTSDQTYTISCTEGPDTFIDSVNVDVSGAPPATGLDVNLSVVVNGGTPRGGPAIVPISVTDSLALSWNGRTGPNTPVNCVATSGFTYSGGVNGSQPVVTPGAGTTQTYSIQCTDSLGNIVTDDVTVRVPNAPSVSLTIKLSTDPIWTSPVGPFVITVGDDVELLWDGRPYSDVCLGSGPSFNTGGVTAGSDTTLGEPSIGNEVIFSVNCTGGGGNASDAIAVRNPATSVQVWPDRPLVDIGDTVEIHWDVTGNVLNDPTVAGGVCTLTGPGGLNRVLNVGEETSAAAGGGQMIVVQGESDFQLSCVPNNLSSFNGTYINPGASDGTTVNVSSTVVEE